MSSFYSFKRNCPLIIQSISLIFSLLFLSDAAIGQCIIPGHRNLTSQEEVDAFVALHAGSDCIVDGYLLIGEHGSSGEYSNITDISGLSNIIEIKGSLFIQNNGLLNSLEGLHNLVKVGEDVRIYKNTVLENIEYFTQLDEIEERLWINQNDALQNVIGFPNLQTVGTDLIISQSPNLLSIEGFSALNQSQFFSIYDCPVLETIDGFDHFSDLAGYFYWNNLPALVNVTMFENLVSIGGNLNITGCSTLSHLSFLQNLEHIGDGFLSENNHGLLDFSSLTNLSYIGGRISITGNQSLLSFAGLENLTTIESFFFFSHNPLLADISQLSNVDTIKNHLLIQSNNSLTHINGLANVKHYGGGISVQSNENLTDLSAFSTVKRIGGDLNIQYCPNVDLCAFNQLEYIGRNLWIQYNDSLQNLDCFANLKEVEEHVLIANNTFLEEINGFDSLETVGVSFQIKHNASLNSLLGMTQLSEIGNNKLEVNNNPNLEVCCGILPIIQNHPNLEKEIYQNAVGCQIETEIEDNCGVDCTAISITTDEESMTVSGLNGAPVGSLQIFDTNWQQQFSCFGNCNDEETINLSPGDYLVYVKYYNSNYSVICEVSTTIIINQTGGCTDADNDGFCQNEDCDDTNPNLPADVGTPCDDNDSTTENDVILEDGCSCEGTAIGGGNDPDCNDLIFQTDENGIIVSGLSAAPVSSLQIFNSNWQQQFSCFGDCANIETVDLPNGIYYVYAKFYTADYQLICQQNPTLTVTSGTGGCIDNDNDGFCEDADCDDNNPNLPAEVGTLCDDGDVNTENDQIQADGCQCEGTPIGGDNTPNCEDIEIIGGEGFIEIKKLDEAPISSLQVFDSNWQQQFSCFADCLPTEILNLPIGSYYVYAKYYESDYTLICQNAQTITVTSDGGNCTDADADGYCLFEDCDDNDATLPADIGTPCEDGDSNTENDEIQADGCTCEGTPMNGNMDECDALLIDVTGNELTIDGLDVAPVASIQVFELPTWSTTFSCFADCELPQQNLSLPDGDYRVYVKLYSENYQQICEKILDFTVNSSSLLAQQKTFTKESQAESLFFKTKETATIFPNPAFGVVNLNFGKALPTNAKWTLVNQYGQTVHQTNLPALREQYQIDLTEIKDGIYFYTVHIENGKRFTGKLLLRSHLFKR